MDDRKLTFGARRALAIIGSLEGRLFRGVGESEDGNKALREQDRQILLEVDGGKTVREVISSAGLELEEGLHSIAWLINTAFVYSETTIAKMISRQADRISMFAELFSDKDHGFAFWQDVIDKAIKTNVELKSKLPGIKWDELLPQLTDPLPSPNEIEEFFLHLFIELYDKAEELYGSQAVMAKRILLDIRSR